MSVIECIKTGLKLAEKDIQNIANLGDEKFDVKPKEDQIKCALYKAFHDKGYLVHVEASYARNGERCDLIASKGKSRIAIEIKTAWAGVGWVNKPAEQLSLWETDIEKLRSLKENGHATHGFFVLCFAYQKGSDWESTLKSKISELNNAKKFSSFGIEDWNGLTKIDFFLLNAFAG